jgi:DNA-directed RNA polymerase specialized sigma subunit
VLQRLDDAEGAIRRLSDRLKVLERPVAAETAELKTKRKSKPTSDIRQKVFELHDSGMIQKKIATEIGISPSYVCTILKQR